VDAFFNGAERANDSRGHAPIGLSVRGINTKHAQHNRQFRHVAKSTTFSQSQLTLSEARMKCTFGPQALSVLIGSQLTSVSGRAD